MTNLSDLNMTTRTYNALRRNGFETLEGVAEKTEAEMKSLRGISSKMLNEIRFHLDNEGLMFLGED